MLTLIWYHLIQKHFPYKLLIPTAKNSHLVKATELQELEAQPSHQVHINVVTFHEESGLTFQ
jgi:hypothetical protein